MEARVSRDAHWVAYTSNETGRAEVYVQSYPASDRKTLVSEGGGSDPKWRRDGRELYYWHGDELIAVALTSGSASSALAVRSHTTLFRAARIEGAGYDVTPDGSQFIFVAGGPGTTRLVVALDALGANEQADPRR
jgi:Tol biopolymer transport system component